MRHVKLIALYSFLGSLFFSGITFAEEKTSAFSGSVGSYWKNVSTKDNKDAETKTQQGMAGSAILGWSGETKLDDWTGKGRFEMELADDNTTISQNDKYVSLENEKLLIVLGRSYDHLNGGAISPEYCDETITACAASLGYFGTAGTYISGLRIGLKGDFSAHLMLTSGSNNTELHEKGFDASKKTDDSGVGAQFGFDAGAVKIAASCGSFSSSGNKNQDASSDGYKLETGIIAVGLGIPLGSATPFINYQQRTQKNETAKTGNGFTWMEIGANVKFSKTLGLSATYNSKTFDNENSDLNVSETSMALGVVKSVAKVNLAGGYSSTTTKTKTDSFNSQSELGLSMAYAF